MSWVSYLFPRIVLRTKSSYNRDIRVIEEAGRLKLLVNGSRQSGPYIEKLWRYALDHFRIDDDQVVKRILVLGVGGGTVIHLLHKIFPKAAITGVEIDPVMIDLGKKYFGLDRSLVNVFQADAHKYVHKYVQKRAQPFDLIIIDLFVGREIPAFVSSKQFLKELRRLKGESGRIIINYLREQEYSVLSDKLEVKLREFFALVQDAALGNNRFFFV